jgi:hypothetical protein
MTDHSSSWALAAIATQLPSCPFESIKVHSHPLQPRGLTHWYRLNYHAATKPSERFNIAFSREQLLSYQLLYEWWTAQYQDPAFSLHAILEYISSCPEAFICSLDGINAQAEAEEAWKLVLGFLRLRQWPRGDISGPHPEPPPRLGRHYHERMLLLFMCEFLFDSCYAPLNESKRSFEYRADVRRQAAVYAYAQRFAWETYMEHKSVCVLEGMAEEEPTKITPSLPGVFLRPHDLFLARGPVLNPCPWLSNDIDELNNMPYHLWDIENSCTVITSALAFRPDYVAISHTWGRWVKGSPIAMKGVPGWRVPQNKLFDIQDLPSLLKKVPGGMRYAWMDLLCIPQDGSIIGTQEIARQAKIFQGAKYAVAWLNQVHSFEGLRSILQWQALQQLVLQSKEDEEIRNACINKTWQAIGGKQSGLLQARNGHLCWENIGLGSWFTSLWTLQEVCLRPDMWLCTADWSFLSCGTDSNVPMPISGLVAVFHTWKEGADDRLMIPLELDPEKQSHVALWELVSWHWRTGLIKLLGLDRAAVISLGDRRECTGRRAEAIMSVLGVTQWYKNALATKDPMLSLEELERDLVLDKYPLDFVNELAAAIPADMFSALQKLNIDTARGGSIQDIAQEGTMLPFSRTHAYYEDADNFRVGGFPSVTHDSVARWRVQRDGSVLIPQACVIGSPATASDPSATEKVLPAQLKGCFPSDIGHAPLSPGRTSSSLGIDFAEREYISSSVDSAERDRHLCRTDSV